MTQKAKLSTRIRYHFDNSIAKGPQAFIAWLAVLGLVIAAGLTVIKLAFNQLPKGNLVPKVQSGFWNNINSVLFAGNIPTGSLKDRLTFFLTWVATITVSATIIAFVTSKLTSKLALLKSGKSPIIEHDHVLILGWSNRVFPIIKELAVANQNKKRPLIVVLSNKSIDFMETELQARVSDLIKTRVVFRSGDPTNPKTLLRANIMNAHSIIALDEDSTGDAAIISTVLAIKAVDPKFTAPVVVEINDRSHGDALSQATNGKVISVESNQVIARVTAQASRRPGLTAVVLDLLDFDGDEIYFQNVPEVTGKSYLEAQLSFEKASIIGVHTALGISILNPDPKRVIKADDELIAIAEDDDKVTYTGRPTSGAIKKSKAIPPRKVEPAHILIIGWSEMGEQVLTELAPFLPARSSVHVVADPQFISSKPAKSYGSIRPTFSEFSGSITELAAIASKKRYDEIIVLAYRKVISTAEADSNTMLTMLLLNRLFDEDGNGVDRTRLVAEILDSRQTELARVANADDLVVSDNLAALMVAQLSQNPKLAPIFQDLFDADGVTINVRPIGDYVQPGEVVDYLTLVSLAAARGETAIGYRTKSEGVLLNPAKSRQIITHESEALIVLSGK